MSVSEYVTKQVCAIDHFIGKYSFLLINQFNQLISACHIHQRAGRRPGLCRSTSALLLIGSTIREFSIGSALWVSEVLCCLYRRSSYLIDHSLFWWMDVAVNWSTLRQECRRAVFWARCFSFCTPQNFFPFWRISLLVMLTTPL